MALRGRNSAGDGVGPEDSPWAGQVDVSEPADITWETESVEPDRPSATDATRHRLRWIPVGVVAVVVAVTIVVATSGDGDTTQESARAEVPTTLGDVPAVVGDTETTLPEVDREEAELDVVTGAPADVEVSTRTPTVGSVLVEVPEGVPKPPSPYELLLVTSTPTDAPLLRTWSMPSGRVRAASITGLSASGPDVSALEIGQELSAVSAWSSSVTLISREGTSTRIPLADADGGRVESAQVVGHIDAGDETTFVVQGYAPDSGEPMLFLVDLDEVVDITPEPYRSLVPVSETVSVVVDDAGGIYLVDAAADDSVTRLSAGALVAFTTPWMLVRECDAQLRCGLVAISVLDGTRIEYDVGDDVIGGIGWRGAVTVSPDGRKAVVGDIDADGSATYEILWSSGETFAVPLVGSAWHTTIGWTPDSTGFFHASRGFPLRYVGESGDVVEFDGEDWFDDVIAVGVRPVASEWVETQPVGDLSARLSEPVDVDVIGVDEETMVHLDLGPADDDPSDITIWPIPTLGARPYLQFVDGQVAAVSGNGRTVFQSRLGEVTARGEVDEARAGGQRYDGPAPGSVWRDVGGGFVLESMPLHQGADVPRHSLDIETSSVLGGDGAGGLVFERATDVYVQSGDGAQRLTTGELVAVGPSTAFAVECESSGGCGLVEIDRTTGERSGQPADLLQVVQTWPTSGGWSLEGSVSPDGTIILTQPSLLPPGDSESSSGWALLDVDDLSFVTLPDLDRRQPLLWTADSSFAFFLAGGTVQVYDRAAGEVVVLERAGSFDRIVLVPRSFAE